MKKFYPELEDKDYFMITYGEDRFAIRDKYKNTGYIWDNRKLYSLCLEKVNSYFHYFYTGTHSSKKNQIYILKLYDI
jgi:hypothetical protein